MVDYGEIAAVPWDRPDPPERVLAIRLQAFGDIVGTLPGLRALRERLPQGRLDLLTRRDFFSIPKALTLFDHVHGIRGQRNIAMQRLSALALLPRLRALRYDMVVDLQNNRISRLVRRGLPSPAFSVFDRFSPVPHGERVRRALLAAWPGHLTLRYDLSLRNPQLGADLIDATDRGRELIVLNPAGFFPTRHWPLDNYLDFARLWLEHRNADARFIILGLARIRPRAAAIAAALPEHIIDLVGQTTPAEALRILQQAALVVSEDSGLLHMAWVSGRPTVALFGSTKSVWSRPVGDHAVVFDSTDLPCGECMQATCRFGDVRCLTRFSAEQVFERATALLARPLPDWQRSGPSPDP